MNHLLKHFTKFAKYIKNRWYNEAVLRYHNHSFRTSLLFERKWVFLNPKPFDHLY